MDELLETLTAHGWMPNVIIMQVRLSSAGQFDRALKIARELVLAAWKDGCVPMSSIEAAEPDALIIFRSGKAWMR